MENPMYLERNKKAIQQLLEASDSKELILQILKEVEEEHKISFSKRVVGLSLETKQYHRLVELGYLKNE